MRCLVLTLLVGVASAKMGGEDMERLQRILKSPIVQRVASELGINIPELPNIANITNTVLTNADNVDINEMLAPVADTGCLPEGFAVDSATQDMVRNCISSSYDAIKSNPLLAMRGCPQYGSLTSSTTTTTSTTRRPRRRRPGQWRRRGRRGIRDQAMERAMDCAMKLTHQCVVANLSLVQNDELSQSAYDALVDSFTAPDEYKAHRKLVGQTCIAQTPPELTGSQRASFQMRCLGEMACVDCTLGVADKMSPTIGLMARDMASMCFDEALEPPPRALIAYSACMADQVSDFMRGRLTAIASGRRRRHAGDDMDAMQAMKMMGGLEGLEKLLGTAPPRPPCRNTFFRRCPPPSDNNSTITQQDVDEAVGRAEAIVGPLDELVSGFPVRVYSSDECWHQAMGTLNTDGSIDLASFRAVMDQFQGDDVIKASLAALVDYCETEGQTSSAGEFHDCMSTSGAYACRLLQIGEELQEQQG